MITWISSSAGLYPGGADAVDLVHEDDGGSVLPKQQEF